MCPCDGRTNQSFDRNVSRTHPDAVTCEYLIAAGKQGEITTIVAFLTGVQLRVVYANIGDK